VINAGTVQLGNAAALGTGGEVTTVVGGTLDLNGQSVGAQPVALGSGVSLINSSASTASLGGVVTLAGAATINAQGGNLYLPGGENGSSYILTITGAANTYATGPLNLGTGGITKSGNGVLVLSSSNSYTGATTVSAGTVQLSGQGSLPAASSVTISSGATFDLNDNSTTLGALSGAGNVLIESATLSIGANNVNTTFSGAITGTGPLTKIGTGTLTLSGSNAFSGIAVSSGILSLASANAIGAPGTNVTVFQGGTLDLGGQTLNGNALLLNGTGTASEPGALYNSSGNTASVLGPITIASPTTIYAGVGPIVLSGTVTGNTTLTFSGGGNTTVSGKLSLGIGGLTKLGTGTLFLSPSQAPTYSGPTTINAGTVQLSSTAGPAIPGNLTIGDGSGSYSASVLFNGNSQLSSSSTVTVNQACSLNLNGFSNTAASLSVAGGSILTNGGGFTTGMLTTAGANLSSASGTIQVTGSMLNSPSSATTFVTTPTTVQGVILNNGSLSVSGAVSSASGMTNNSTLTVTTTGAIVGNGTGLDNEGSLFLNGGTITGSGPVLNDGVVSGYGVLDGAGGITNYSQITQSGGTLTISNSGTNLNYGTTTLTSGYQFRLTGGNFTNFGTVNLDSGVVAGSASLMNSYGGTISGPGTILTSFSNTGGSMILGYGSTVVEQNFTNTGIVNLESYEASLTGGALNNVGTIQGQGNVGNNITNTGIIEAIGGTLTLSGTVQNGASGLITAATGNKVLMVAGMAINQGVINLTGGTFDNNGFALANTNQISGYGAFRTGSLSNTGTMTFSGGESTIDGNVTNQSKGVVSVKDYPTLFTGNVTNYGVFTSSSASATFAGAFVNDGVYSSDPSSNTFSNLMVGPMGYITAGTGDTFSISGSFTNESSQAGEWNTVGAALLFETGSSHVMMVSGSNGGPSRSGFQSNFAWNTLELGVGQSLTLESGSSGSSAFYVSALVLDGGLSEISSITGNGVDIYYDPSNSSNSYLSGDTFELADGGELAPISPVPEPGSAGLIVVAIFGAALGVAQRRGRIRYK
jgi:autotransporter-associated beta strand protein